MGSVSAMQQECRQINNSKNGHHAPPDRPTLVLPIDSLGEANQAIADSKTEYLSEAIRFACFVERFGGVERVRKLLVEMEKLRQVFGGQA